MTVLMFAAVALVAYRLWMRVREAETTIEKLTGRVAALELTRPIDVPLRRTPGSNPVDVRPPQPFHEPSSNQPEPPKPAAVPVLSGPAEAGRHSVATPPRAPAVESHALESQIGS